MEHLPANTSPRSNTFGQEYYQRPMAPPSGFNSNPFYQPRAPTLKTQTPDSTHPSAKDLAPALHFHSSPYLQSLFPVSLNTDPTQQPSSDQLSLPTSFSPSAFGLSPPAFNLTEGFIAPTPPSNPQYATFPFDAANTSGGGAAATPGAQSQTSGSYTAGSETGPVEKDPFLSLLEQLAENENSQGGPSELDFFLGVDDGEKEEL